MEQEPSVKYVNYPKDFKFPEFQDDEMCKGCPFFRCDIHDVGDCAIRGNWGKCPLFDGDNKSGGSKTIRKTILLEFPDDFKFPERFNAEKCQKCPLCGLDDTEIRWCAVTGDRERSNRTFIQCPFFYVDSITITTN
jgi:hypothetical protein